MGAGLAAGAWLLQDRLLGLGGSVAVRTAAASAHGRQHKAPPASDCPFCLLGTKQSALSARNAAQPGARPAGTQQGWDGAHGELEHPCFWGAGSGWCVAPSINGVDVVEWNCGDAPLTTTRRLVLLLRGSAFAVGVVLLPPKLSPRGCRPQHGPSTPQPPDPSWARPRRAGRLARSWVPLEGELTPSSGLQSAQAGVQRCAGLHPHGKRHPGKACGGQPAPNTSACSAVTPSSAARGSAIHLAHTVTLSAEDSWRTAVRAPGDPPPPHFQVRRQSGTTGFSRSRRL